MCIIVLRQFNPTFWNSFLIDPFNCDNSFWTYFVRAFYSCTSVIAIDRNHKTFQKISWSISIDASSFLMSFLHQPYIFSTCGCILVVWLSMIATSVCHFYPVSFSFLWSVICWYCSIFHLFSIFDTTGKQSARVKILMESDTVFFVR